MTTWPFSFSDTIAVVGAAAAVVAAIFAYRADRLGRRQSQQADSQRRNQIRPIIRLGPMRVVGQMLELTLLNAGGAASASWIAMRVGRQVYTGIPALPPSTLTSVSVRLSLVGEVERIDDLVRMLPSEILGVRVIDIDGNAWDAIFDKPWAGGMPRGVTAQTIVDWAHQRQPGSLYADRPRAALLRRATSRMVGWATNQLVRLGPDTGRPGLWTGTAGALPQDETDSGPAGGKGET